MNSPHHPHAITLEKNPHHVKVTFHGTVIADTQRALLLREGSLPPVNYIPREDVNMSYLQRTDHSTHCPFKGDASYYTVKVDDRMAENAVWSYEAPFASIDAIKEYMVCYHETMDTIEELPSIG